MSANLHATALIVGETGVLLRGASGSGKSAVALALLERAAGCGLFARLVGDDRVWVECRHGRLLARPHPLIAGKIERFGAAIEHHTHEPVAIIGLVVDLLPAHVQPIRLPEASDCATQIETVALPRLQLPACGVEDRAAAIIANLRRKH